MGPVRQAVFLLLQCVLFINSSPAAEKTLSELNEQYRPQIWALLDHLNADPYRAFNYKVYKYENAIEKGDVLYIEIEVGAECVEQRECSRAVLQCRGFVEYVPDVNNFRALPGAECQEKWRENANNIPEVSASVNEEEVLKKQITPQNIQCLGCLTEIDKNAEGIDSLVQLALQHIESERTRKHSVLEVVSVHRQIVAGVKYVLVVKVAPTLCPNDPNLINADLCPIDQQAEPEYCGVQFFQRPTISTDDHIVFNNCTVSQEYTPRKAGRNDFDNEIDVNGYQKPVDPKSAGPNFEQIAESGTLEGLTPERLAAVEAQIIPTDPTRLHAPIETTKSVIDNSQLGVEDIPSVQTSTDIYQQHVANEQKIFAEAADFDQRAESNVNIGAESSESEYPNGGYRASRQAAPPQSSESQSSEEAGKQVKREVPPPGSSESKDSSEVKRQESPKSSESHESSEEAGKTPDAPKTKRQAPQPKQSSESQSSEEATAVPKVKRQAPPKSSESSDYSEEAPAPKTKRQAPPPKQSSESDESSEEAVKTPDAAAPKTKRQAPPPKQSSESQSSEEATADPKVKRQAPPESSESSEEAGNTRVKRAAKDDSSSSSSSSEEDDNNNNNGKHDDDNNNHNGDDKKSHKKNKKDHDDDDDNGKNGKQTDKNGDSSSSSSSSSDEDDKQNNNRRRRAAGDDDSIFAEEFDERPEDDDDSSSLDARRKRAVKDDTSSSSSDDDDNNGNGKKEKERDGNDNDTSSSSSSDDEDKKQRRKRNAGALVRPKSDEKLEVRRIAEFAARSFDDRTHKHGLLEVLRVKKLELEGAVYHLFIRVGVTKCDEELCTPDGEKLCKVQVYVSPDGKMKVKKSHSHKIIPEADKNRTDNLDGGEVILVGGESNAVGDPEIKELTKASLLKLDSDSPHENKYKIVEILEAKKQVVAGMLYTIKARVVLSDCPKIAIKDSELCSALERSMPKVCDIRIWDQPWMPEGRETNITCDQSENFHYRAKRQVPGGTSDARNDPNVIELTKYTLFEMDKDSPHENKFKVIEILKATKQVVAGMLYKIKAKVILSDCSKADTKEPDQCGKLESDAPRECYIRILDQPWMPHGRETNVTCDAEEYSFTSGKRAKRAAPGSILPTENDEEVAELLRTTMLQLDAHTPHKNKYKVFKVLGATEQVVAGTLYRIKVKLVLSDCLKTDPKESHQCSQLSSESPKKCNIEIWERVWLPNGRQTEVKCEGESYQFKSDSPDHKLAKREIPLVGGPIPAKDAAVKELLRISIPEVDKQTPHENKYKVLEVINSTTQVVAGSLYKITARLVLSDCPKSDPREYQECGQLQAATPEECTITVWDRPWLPDGRQITMKCATEKYDFKTNHPSHKLSKREVKAGGVSANEDAATTELLHTTMFELDAHTPHENKYKVARVIKSTKQVVSGSLYKITAELVLSDCLKTDPKRSHECGQLASATPKVCEIKIWDQPWLVDGKETTVACGAESYLYKTDSRKRSKRQAPAPGALTDAKLDPLITELTKSTLLYLDSRSPHEMKYKIVEILDAKKQIVSGTKYLIKAKIILSECRKDDSKDPNYCPESKTAQPRVCDIKIWDQSWMPQGRRTNITCDSESYQYRTGRSSETLGRGDHDFHYGLFRKFMGDFDRKYKNKGELKMRFHVFMDNMKAVEVLNKNEQGTAIYGATKFADLTRQEFQRFYLGYRPDLRNENDIRFAMADIPDVDLPKGFDWREKNAVTEVKNQEQCGSCWAFSVTGNVEGQYALKYGKLLEFSEQELVDCDKMDDGCNGGLMDNAYRAIEKMGGLELESQYPYDAMDETCHFDRSLSKVQLSGALNISHDETDMAKWLVQNGPISIAINANAMQFYMGGVSHPAKFLCSPDNLDHGVLIVGYGVHKYPLFNRTLPYWIVKNSWGTSWGEQGYYRVFRGGGTCGLNQTPSSAVVA